MKIDADKKREVLDLLAMIEDEAMEIRGDWSDPRPQCYQIQSLCVKIADLLRGEDE